MGLESSITRKEGNKMKSLSEETSELMEATKVVNDVETLRRMVVSLGNLLIKGINRIEALETQVVSLGVEVQAAKDRASTAEVVAKAAGGKAGHAMQAQVARDRARHVEKVSPAKILAAVRTIAASIGYDKITTIGSSGSKLGLFQWCLPDGTRVTCRSRVMSIPGMKEYVESMLPKHTRLTRVMMLQAVASACSSRKGKELLSQVSLEGV